MRRLRLSLASLLVLAGCSESEEDTTTTTTGDTSGPSATATDSNTPGSSGGATSDTTDPGASATSSTSVDPTTGTGPAESSTSAGTSTGEPTGYVVMETSLGTITLELFPEQAPVTVENFLAYIDAGFYDGTDGLGQTIFHRVIPGFVIQGGGLTDTLDGKATTAPIVNEHDTSGLTNDRGTLSMARTSDPDSATSQFFINLVDNAGLDESPGYAVFARVVEGLDIVDAIAAVETTTVAPFDDVPARPVFITSVTLE